MVFLLRCRHPAVSHLGLKTLYGSQPGEDVLSWKYIRHGSL